LTLKEIAQILDARFHCGEDKGEMSINSVCAGDLMSDLLAYSHGHALLLTGMANPQVIRTAEMLDLAAIVFINGKEPADDMVRMAVGKGIPLLTTRLPLYTGCGLLYAAGLK
jgi:predicted transcriptional regulator